MTDNKEAYYPERKWLVNQIEKCSGTLEGIEKLPTDSLEKLSDLCRNYLSLIAYVRNPVKPLPTIR